MLKPLVVSALFLAAACAHDESNHSVTDSMRELGRDVGRVMESTNTPNSAEDPSSVRSRVHTQVVPLRERLEKIRQRTNNNLAAKKADGKDLSQKELDEQAAIEAELNRMEDQLNKIDHPEEAPAP